MKIFTKSDEKFIELVADKSKRKDSIASLCKYRKFFFFTLIFFVILILVFRLLTIIYKPNADPSFQYVILMFLVLVNALKYRETDSNIKILKAIDKIQE